MGIEERMGGALPRDFYVGAADEGWVPFGEHVWFKLLRVSPETGAWTVFFKRDAGSVLGPHRHLSGAEYYIISGRMELRGGAEKGGVTASAGDYGYEANGALHEQTYYPEDTVMLFACHGPVEVLDEQGNLKTILDWKVVRDKAVAARK